MKPKSFRNSLLTASLALVFASASAHAAITIDASSWGIGAGSPTNSGASSTGLIWGDNTANNADDSAVHATIDGDTGTAGNQSVTIALGQTLTLTGTVNLVGLTNGTTTGNVNGNQFRVGLFDSNGQSGNTGWLGYMLSTGSGSTAGSLKERANPNIGFYTSGFGSSDLDIGTPTAPGANTFDGLYDFSFSLHRISTGMEITSSFVRQSTNVDYAPRSTAFLDTTISTSTFDRIGFLSGNALDADQITLSNISLTLIPEPSTALLGSLGMLLLLRRRRA
jgi:hypothetical protein